MTTTQESIFDYIVGRNIERLFNELDEFHYDDGVSKNEIMKMLHNRVGDLDDQYDEWFGDEDS